MAMEGQGLLTGNAWRIQVRHKALGEREFSMQKKN